MGAEWQALPLAVATPRCGYPDTGFFVNGKVSPSRRGASCNKLVAWVKSNCIGEDDVPYGTICPICIVCMLGNLAASSAWQSLSINKMDTLCGKVCMVLQLLLPVNPLVRHRKVLPALH